MKPIRLFFPFVNFAVKRELEFRFNLAFFLFFDLLWIAVSLLAVILIFNQAGTVAGWTKTEAILLLLVYYLAGSAIKSFVIPATEELSELIRLGKLDLFLLKPMGLRTLVVFSHMYLHEMFRFTLMIFAIPWYLGMNHIAVQPEQWLKFLILIIAGCVGFSGVYFAVAALSFKFQYLFNLSDFFREALDVAKRPLDIFPGFFRSLVTFGLPVGLVASIPARVLLSDVNWLFVFKSVGVITITFLLTDIFFRFCLRSYSSASS